MEWNQLYKETIINTLNDITTITEPVAWIFWGIFFIAIFIMVFNSPPGNYRGGGEDE